MSLNMLVPVIAIQLVITAFAGGYLFVRHEAYDSLLPDECKELKNRERGFEAWERHIKNWLAAEFEEHGKFENLGDGKLNGGLDLQLTTTPRFENSTRVKQKPPSNALKRAVRN